MRIWFLRLKRCRGKPTLMIIWCATSRVSISPPRPSSAMTAASGPRAPPSLRSSLSLSLSLSKFFQIFFGFDFQNSVRSGCFSCSIFIFLNFFLNFFIDLCGELVFLNLFVFLENFIRKMLYTLIRLISWGSGCHCSSAIDLDGINVIWFWICRNFRFWFRDFSVKFVGLERKFWILRFFFSLYWFGFRWWIGWLNLFDRWIKLSCVGEQVIWMTRSKALLICMKIHADS